MKFRVGACALLVCLAGCSQKGTNTKFGDLMGSASPSAHGAKQVPHVQAGRNPANSIANAPDRGALVSYKNKGVASKQEGAYTWYPVAISEEHALKAVATGQMTIPSPDGSQVKLRYERHVEHADGNWTWIGRVEGGDQKQEAILTFGEEAVYGSIPQAAGAPALSLQTRAGVLWAVVTDLSKVVSPNKGKNDVMVPPALALRASLASAATKAQVMQGAVAAGAPATSANTIDVAIGYTQGFATAQGGQSAAVTRLNFLVEVGNQAFTNSLINGYLRIVNTVQVSYADDTANEAALGQLTGNNGTSSVAIPAALVPLRTARDQYGADLAVLVRKFQTPENDGCGIAWLNGADQTPISPTADDDFGFAVISDGNDTGTDGKSYFCSPETLVHELGHLMGSAHDRENSKVNLALPATGTNLQYGRYPYSFGMKTDNTSGNFYTIMAYGDDNQNFYRTFSNPLVARCGPAGNLICGAPDQTDNARSLNQTIPVVALFRNTVVPVGKFVANDVNGDGKSELLWRAGGDVVYWVMNGPTMTSSVYAGNIGYTAATQVGSGDFNADGYADLIFDQRTGSASSLRQWIGNGTGGFTAYTLPYSGNWVPFGAADIDGDGKSELLWRSVADVAYWVMNGNIFQSSVYVGNLGEVDFKLIGTGDFNRDGRADLIFDLRKPWGNYLRKWISNAQGGFNVYTEGYSGTWTPFGVADIDADNKSELLWRSGADIAYWVVDGPTFQSSVYVGNLGDVGFSPVGIGDYNLDGRADLIFDLRKPWGNYLRKLISNGQGGFSITTEAYSGTWQPFDPAIK